MSQVEIYDLIMSIGYKRLNCKARHGVIPYSFLERVLQVYVTNVCFLCAESMRHKCSAEMTQVHFFHFFSDQNESRGDKWFGNVFIG